MEDCPCLQNHITNPIQEATAQSHCSLCWANFWKSMWETYWLTTLKNSILSLPNSGALHMVNPPLELYSLLLITGTDYLTQDLTSALYSSTLVKRSTQSPTDPYYRSSNTCPLAHLEMVNSLPKLQTSVCLCKRLLIWHLACWLWSSSRLCPWAVVDHCLCQWRHHDPLVYQLWTNNFISNSADNGVGELLVPLKLITELVEVETSKTQQTKVMVVHSMQ